MLVNKLIDGNKCGWFQALVDALRHAGWLPTVPCIPWTFHIQFLGLPFLYFDLLVFVLLIGALEHHILADRLQLKEVKECEMFKQLIQCFLPQITPLKASSLTTYLLEKKIITYVPCLAFLSVYVIKFKIFFYVLQEV